MPQPSRKLMLLGEIGVGKTSLVNRYVHGRFRTDYMPTLNVEIYTHNLPETDTRPALTLLIWDTDGNFGQTIFSSVYLKNASAALIVADVTRPTTIEAKDQLLKGWKNAMPGRPACILLNKSDLLGDTERSELGTAEAEHSSTPAFLTSALSGDGVGDAFTAAADAIIRRGL
ncbi:MAG: Rab family GTPase [Filomicrobium sp.]